MGFVGLMSKWKRMVLCAVFWDFFAVGLVLPLIPFYAQMRFGLGPLREGFMIGAWGFAQTIGAVFLGSFADRFSAHRVLSFSLGGGAVSYALLASAASFHLFLAARALIGFVKNTHTLAQIILLRDVQQNHARQQVAYLDFCMFAGLTMGPIVGNVLGHTPEQFPLVARISAAILLADALVIFFCSPQQDLQHPTSTATHQPTYSLTSARLKSSSSSLHTNIKTNSLPCTQDNKESIPPILATGIPSYLPTTKLTKRLLFLLRCLSSASYIIVRSWLPSMVRIKFSLEPDGIRAFTAMGSFISVLTMLLTACLPRHPPSELLISCSAASLGFAYALLARSESLYRVMLLLCPATLAAALLRQSLVAAFLGVCVDAAHQSLGSKDHHHYHHQHRHHHNSKLYGNSNHESPEFSDVIINVAQDKVISYPPSIHAISNLTSNNHEINDSTVLDEAEIENRSTPRIGKMMAMFESPDAASAVVGPLISGLLTNYSVDLPLMLSSLLAFAVAVLSWPRMFQMPSKSSLERMGRVLFFDGRK